MEVAMAVDQGRVAMVVGATGLVGREILAVLLADKTYAKVHSVGRRASPLSHAKLIQHQVDFAALPSLPRVTDCFIALGTTIKVAGSQAAFRAIDFDAVRAVALAAHASGAINAGVVSAMGADPQSMVFYNRVKGEMEGAMLEVGFDCLVIARPSMLAGQRETLGQPVRAGERIALLVTRGLGPLIPANYRSIAAESVARSLVRAMKNGVHGNHLLLSGDMQTG
jgi:uncharacterized protein YbjT (DUF2867 family)